MGSLIDEGKGEDAASGDQRLIHIKAVHDVQFINIHLHIQT